MSLIWIEEPIGILSQTFLQDMSQRLEYLAMSKDELTPANVEPFQIDLSDPTPYHEKPMRYNRTLTQFVN